MESNRLGAYDVILSLAANSVDECGFLVSALDPIAESLGGLYATLTARLPAQLVHEGWQSAGADSAFWKQPTEELVTNVLQNARPCGRVYRTRGAGATVAALAAPLRTANGGCDGAVVVVAPCAGESEAREAQAALESLAHLVSGSRSRFEEGAGRAGLSTDLEAAGHLAKVSEYSAPRELAFALTNNLRARMACDQVALGLGENGRVDVLSISGYDEVRPESPGTGTLRAAMEECLDAGERTVFQQDTQWAGEPLSAPYRLHRKWHDECGRAAVASLPISVDDAHTAIVSLRRPAAEPFSSEELDEVTKLVEPFIGALGLLERSTRSLPRHARDELRAAVAAARAPGHSVRKASFVLVGMLALWALFGAMPYRLSVPTIVRATESRHLSAPHEAVLESIGVIPGDRVRAGDVMATFQHAELLLELERLRADLVLEELGARGGMAGRAPHDVEMARARRRLLEARIATTQDRIAAATVHAPFDGLVVSGDLRKRIGERLQIGEPLFELTSGDLRLELEVPEYAAADVAAGQAGEFASHARPGEVQEFEIVRVEPHTVSRRGQGVYLAEARAALDSSWMRPGVEGIAKVRIGERTIIWAVFHRAIDYLRLRFWL